jgi:hypothetical protein
MTITIRPNVLTDDKLGRMVRGMRTNAALAAAVNAVAPEYVPLGEQLALLQRTAPKVLPLRTDDDLAAELMERLAAGDGVPTDLLTTVATVADGAAAWERASRLLNGIAERLVEERTGLLEGSAGALLAHLRGQLTHLIDALPDDVRDAPRTADAAIATGRADDYQALQIAAQSYATIRDAQGHVARATWSIEFSAAGTWWPILGYLENPEIVWPSVLEQHATGAVRNEHGSRVPATPPWPDLSSPEALEWLLDHPKARPWVPTADQYADATLRLDMATSAIRQRGRAGNDWFKPDLTAPTASERAAAQVGYRD